MGLRGGGIESNWIVGGLDAGIQMIIVAVRMRWARDRAREDMGLLFVDEFLATSEDFLQSTSSTFQVMRCFPARQYRYTSWSEAEQNRAERQWQSLAAIHSLAQPSPQSFFFFFHFGNQDSRKEKKSNDNNDSGTADSDWFRIVAAAAAAAVSHEKPNSQRPIRWTS